MRHLQFAKSTVLIVVSFGFRLAAGMLVIVLLARSLGPSDFGAFVYWLSVATLLGVPISLGLPTFILREMGADHGRYAALMAVSLTAKLLVFAAILALALLASIWLDGRDRSLFLLLLVAQAVESFADLLNLGFRRAAAYAAEAATAIMVSSLHLAVMVGVVLFAPDVLLAAAAFMASRCVGALIVLRRSTRLAGPLGLAPPNKVAGLMREVWPYAGELGIYTAYGQMDSLIVHHYLGVTGVGVYQAGMKLVDGACRLAPVLAQLILPGLTRRIHDAVHGRGAVLKTVAVLGAMGLLGLLVLLLGSDLIVTRLYGAEFHPLGALLPGFGLLILLKYLETASGLVLVAYGLQQLKIWLVALQFATALLLGGYLIAHRGLAGWQAGVIVSTVLVTVGYAALYLFARRSPKPAL